MASNAGVSLSVITICGVTCKINDAKPLSTDYADPTDVKASLAGNSAQPRNHSLNNQCNLRNLRIGVSGVLQEALW